ncbi:MAG: hypothetical protein M3071_24745 [Actinomycetota bacterium]|nr:hypothetical protein [Actinomycetota bacterium]
MSSRATRREQPASAVLLAREFVDAAVDDIESINDVADLEHLALCLRWPFDLPGVDANWTAPLVEPIEERGDELAAGLLAALVAFSHQPLGHQAAEALARLSGRGIVSPLARRIGTLRVVAACRHEIPGGEAILAMMRRPRQRDAQVALMVVQSIPGGEAIEELKVMTPVRRSRARKALRARFRDSVPHRLTAAALLERLDAAAEHMKDHAIDLNERSIIWLPLVVRALTGRPDALPHLWVERPAPAGRAEAPGASAEKARRAAGRAKSRRARAARKRNRR